MLQILFLISNLIYLHNFSIKYDLNSDKILIKFENVNSEFNFYSKFNKKIGLINFNDLNSKKKINIMNLDEMKKFEYDKFTYEDLLNSGYSELFLLNKYRCDSSDILIAYRNDGIGVYVYYIINYNNEYFDYIATHYLDFDGKNGMFYDVKFEQNKVRVSTILVERSYYNDKVLNNLKIYERNYKIKSRKFELLNFSERDSIVIFD